MVQVESVRQEVQRYIWSDPRPQQAEPGGEQAWEAQHLPKTGRVQRETQVILYNFIQLFWHSCDK